MSEDVDMGATMPDITPQPASHPDAQATVTDFLDYTDYFPSDLTRSLTLIYKLDRLYLETTDEIHALTKIYGALPTLPPNERPDPKLLRKRISAAIDRANHLRESSYAEANRINDEAARYGTRLISIKKKLQALPKPPSRDPTPAPVSPQVLRPRKSTEIDHTPRITLRMDGARQAATGRSRDRRRITPGDVVPMEVDVPEDEGGSESWDDEIDVEQGKNSENVQPQKTEKVSKNKVPRAPRIRPPGVMGTNVHSTVAGISTSNALALLPKPPENPIPGSLHAPWHRLTEYEMAVLRKMMKKNAVWSPSDTMIRRELAEKGRGRENYERAKERARLTGEPFVDEDPIDPNKKVLAPGETSFQPLGKDEMSLINRGMRLNEAKKLKKDLLAKENKEQEDKGKEGSQDRVIEQVQERVKEREREPRIAHNLDMHAATTKIAETGNSFLNLFGDTISLTPTNARKLSKSSRSAKRKRAASPEGDKVDSASQDSRPNTKKPKITVAPGSQTASPVPLPLIQQTPVPPPRNGGTPARPTVTTTTVPLAPPGPSASPVTLPSATTRKETPMISPIEVKKLVSPVVPPQPVSTTPVPPPQTATALVPAPSPATTVVPPTTTASTHPRRESSLFRKAPSPAPSASSTSSSELDDPEDISSPSAPSKLASPALKAARSPSLQLKEEMAEEPSPTETPLPEHEQEATEEDTVMAEDTKTPPTLPITTIEEPTPTPIPRKTPTPGPHTRSTPAPVVTRPPSRRAAAAATKAMSAEPPAAKRESRELRDLRRMSVVETSLSTLPGVGLRSSTRRRPVPGVVTEQEGGKGKVSVGKRKNAPKKRGGGRGKGADGKGEEREEDGEEVDPDEPRYCVCGEVSFGTMIACENDKCEKEWFHLSCVGLTEIPPRRSLWYCPDCRKNLHVDQSGHPSGAASAPVETGRRRRGSR